MKVNRQNHRGLTGLVLAAVLTVSALLGGHVYADNEDRLITITLHAGEYGYFGEETVKEIESVQYKGDAFYDDRVPETKDPVMFFAGWATEPDAEMPNVFNDMTNNSMIGTDLYAVWTDECIVNYTLTEGYFLIDGQQHTAVSMTYRPGDRFQVIEPTHYDENDFRFKYWFKNSFGKTEILTEESVVTGTETDVHAKWEFAEDRVERIEPDREYALEVRGAGRFFAFEPEEDGVYEFYTYGDPGIDTPAFVTILNGDVEKLKDAPSYDSGGNTAVSLYMKAGTVYYFQVREMGGGYAEFKAMLHKPKVVHVTFHVNRDEEQDAWFDDDPMLIEKEMEIALGDNVKHFNLTGLTLKDPQMLEFCGWSLNPEAESTEGDVIAEGDMDVYGVYREMDFLTLDGNGGVFALEDNSPTSIYRFVPGTPFETPLDPRISDNTRKFAGWSADPDAEVPDPDIIEGVTPSDSLPNVLYAVYTEKVSETFDANGGYMLDNPSVTTYFATKGIGHIFYGMVVHHEDERMKAIGFTDQNGTFIPYTAGIDPYYHIEGDTVYTTVWGYQLFADANGGFFPEVELERLKVTMEYEGTFDMTDVLMEVGEPVNDDPNKIFAGWATAPDAEEPDIITGETPVKELDTVYAVWKDDTYYYDEGADASWERGMNDAGLTFVIRREAKEELAYSSFTAVFVDGYQITSEAFNAREGSLILTLFPGFLDDLDPGTHDLSVRFGSLSADTQFYVTLPEAPETSESETVPEEMPEETPAETEPAYEEPETERQSEVSGRPASLGDNGPFWMTVLSLGLIGMVIYLRDKKKEQKEGKAAGQTESTPPDQNEKEG